jgi:nucleolar GTP-binding protein
MDHRYLRWQVIDTPGILDHELEKRNVIEMQAVTALAHLPCAVLFFVDVSEQCGYTLEQQKSLYDSIRPLFADKQLVIVANKVDAKPLEELSADHQQMLKDMCAAHDPDAVLVPMSNVTESGVQAVKDAACDVLLQARVDRRRAAAGGSRLRDKLTRLVATPADAAQRRPALATALPMDADQDRGHSIPASVLAARKAKKLEKRAARAAQDADRLELAALEARDGGHGSTQDAAVQAEAAAQQARQIARDAEQARAASARPPRTTERERMWAGGGPGVYSGETSREYVGQLRCDDFATDIQPEIMDGKNVPPQRLFSRFPNFKLPRWRPAPPRRLHRDGVATRRDRV